MGGGGGGGGGLEVEGLLSQLLNRKNVYSMCTKYWLTA